MLLREEVAQLQEEVHLLRQMKDMLSKDLEETQEGCSANLLSATELRVQLGDKEQELDRAKEALQGQESAQASHPIHQRPFVPAAHAHQLQLSTSLVESFHLYLPRENDNRKYVSFDIMYCQIPCLCTKLSHEW